MQKIEKYKIKAKMPFPLNAMFLIFVIEIIFSLCIFFIFGGINFFVQDINSSLIISVGMLTFVSVFYGFALERDNNFLAHFEDILKSYQDKLWAEIFFEFPEANSVNDLPKSVRKQYNERIKTTKEFIFLANPPLWFYVSIFLFIFTILIFLSNIHYKAIIISSLVHLGILTSWFLITAIATLHTSFLTNKLMEKLIKKVIPNFKIEETFQK